jgi:hypothetical protein
VNIGLKVALRVKTAATILTYNVVTTFGYALQREGEERVRTAVWGANDKGRVTAAGRWLIHVCCQGYTIGHYHANVALFTNLVLYGWQSE